MTKIFKDVRRSLKDGSDLDLLDIGIKRTPFFRLKEKEKAQKAIIKRKDFLMTLKAEQRWFKSWQNKLNRQKLDFWKIISKSK